MHLRNHVLGQLAAAASADDPATRAAALTFVVVGGGFAGVEALAELQGLADEAVRFHPALEAAGLRWVLVEAAGRILPELDERLGQWTLRVLRRRGVEVRLHTRLASAAHGRVVLDDGTELAAGTLVWAAGVRPSPLGAAAGLPADAGRPDPGRRGPGRHRGAGRVRRRGHRGGAGPEPARAVLRAERAARGPAGQGAGP